MKLSKIIGLLSTGELSKVNLGTNEEAGVTVYNHQELVDYINLGLLSIYTKIPLRVREVTVQEQADIKEYFLRSEYAQSNSESTQPVKYILDSENDPFDDTLLSIDTVYDEFGYKMPLNDRLDPCGFVITSFDTIQSNNPAKARKFIVSYRAKAPELLNSGIDILTQNVALPEVLTQVLLYYVAYKVHNSRNTAESQTEAAKFLTLYEKELLQVTDLNIGVDAAVANTKLELRGWV